jgi:hypothetical protein
VDEASEGDAMRSEMNDESNDPQRDETLRRHFAAALDGQAGRARAAFERHVEQQRGAPGRGRTRPRGARAGMWVVAGVGAAMAASLAAIWAVPLMRTTPPTPSASVNHAGPAALGHSQAMVAATSLPSPTTAAALAADGSRWTQVGLAVTSAAVDEGVVVIDDRTPARIVKRLSIERTQWVDPARGVRVETVVPRERTMLIDMDTY